MTAATEKRSPQRNTMMAPAHLRRAIKAGCPLGYATTATGVGRVMSRSQVLAGLVDLERDAAGAGCLGDGGRLGQQRTGVVAAVVGGGDVGLPDQVRGHAGHGADFPAQPG